MKRTDGLENQLSLFEGEKKPTVHFPRRRVNTSSAMNIPVSNRDDDIKQWEKRVRIILPRFPELDRRERISTKEINKRLDELRDTNYYIPQYDRSNNNEAWRCYMIVRKDVQFQAMKYCPETVRLILSQNARKREEARNPFWR